MNQKLIYGNVKLVLDGSKRIINIFVCFFEIWIGPDFGLALKKYTQIIDYEYKRI